MQVRKISLFLPSPIFLAVAFGVFILLLATLAQAKVVSTASTRTNAQERAEAGIPMEMRAADKSAMISRGMESERGTAPSRLGSGVVEQVPGAQGVAAPAAAGASRPPMSPEAQLAFEKAFAKSAARQKEISVPRTARPATEDTASQAAGTYTVKTASPGSDLKQPVIKNTGIVRAMPANNSAAPSGNNSVASANWRIKIKDAAIAAGEHVRLGEIAEPVGEYPRQLWAELSERELWPAPGEAAKPMSISRNNLKEQMRSYLVDLERICIYPSTLTIQQGGDLVQEAELRSLIVKYLTIHLAGMPGEVEVNDVKVPPYIFLAQKGQQVVPELVSKPGPGRMSLRLEVKDMDNSVLRRYTASCFVDVWATVPCAAMPLNKEDVVNPDKVVFMRKNLAHTRGGSDAVWDGRGGPYRVMRAVGAEQVIYQADIAYVPAVRRGGQVQLVYEKGNIRLVANAEAQGDASLGETVTVRNLQSKKLITAVVQSPDTVIVN